MLLQKMAQYKIDSLKRAKGEGERQLMSGYLYRESINTLLVAYTGE